MTHSGGSGASPVVGWKPLREHHSTVGERVNDVLAEAELSLEEKLLIGETIVSNTRGLVKLLRGVEQAMKNNEI